VTRKTFDIAIVGGGVIGLSLARELLRKGASVCVIDAGPAASGATYAAAGMLAPSFERDAAKGAQALYDFGVSSLRQWRDYARALEQETGCDIDYRDDGVLGVALDEDGADALRQEHGALAGRGANVEWLSAQEALSVEPGLSPRIKGALYARDDAQVDPRKLSRALQVSLARADNARSHKAARVEKIDLHKAGATLYLAGAARVEAGSVVLASGAALAELITDAPRAPVYPVKGEALSVQMLNAALRHVVRGPNAYLCPKAGGRVVIGATEHAHRDDLTPDPQAIAALKVGAAEIAPEVIAWPEVERWAGLRPATPDGAPILGCDKRGPGNVFLALGHHRNGILLAPATATALARLIIEKRTDPVLERFRPDRFASGGASDERNGL